MAFKLRLPSFPGLNKELDQATQVAAPPSSATGSGAGTTGRKKYSISRQLKFFGSLFVAILVVTTGLIYVNNRAERAEDARVRLAHQLSGLTHLVSKSATLAQTGNGNGFAELNHSRNEFAQMLDILEKGGEFNGVRIRPAGDIIGPQVEKLRAEWKRTDERSRALLAQQTSYVSLAKFVQDAGGKLGWGGTQGEHLLRGATLLISPIPLDDAGSTQLVRDLRTQVEAAATRSDSSDFGISVRTLHANLPSDLLPFIQARKGAIQLSRETAQLIQATDSLLETLESQTDQRAIYTALVAIFGSLVLALLVVIVKIFNEEAAERTAATETQRQQAESERNSAQEAILRLMNEMGDLADGDLTIRATVTEDITGAIADSVNYTIEELSVLVKRINDAAVRVASASEAAQQTTDELLAATETQSHEIRTASTSVLSMAESMNNVSTNALESARVARVSLAAAQKGSVAVENSIKGMGEIRQQIQETSKRIKRLGESSQEIGEIVELISDITEQTNVLALNAAIQAASAGEAGRGFSVVAEEVQRLAERSAEATKQIAAIVKTIQTDTHDAVSAMENSTQGVVEGAQLSDAAGQALQEISDVSQNLAQLIESISGDTQEQADVATQVAKVMQDILQITEQTTSGTRQTAVSIGQLAELATELKGSVAGFKV